jgi:hypothetical protein
MTKVFIDVAGRINFHLREVLLWNPGPALFLEQV